ncbi:Wzz/FepE/Etk N-terminal domain-containing protein [uncultured Clostridium sp.]|jgi:capsular polysaccharide biosynthesis protein|uniref:YveK family protein n=1 Tax=uncultured Clostridium sp. TaxID=59620 RepID=UPI0025EE058C|nr:Wzz/FepE/Etk N-terminal domain-containing protein [uncultured Clostridium sp.]
MKNISEVLDGIKDKWKNVVLIVLSFLLISSIYNIFFINKEYEANVKIFIGKQKFKNITETYNNEEINLYQRLITTYSEVIKSKKLINESIKDSKMNYLQDKYENINYDLLMENLTVNPIANTQIIEIKYKSLNPQQSYDLLYSITENLISYSKELYPNVNITILEQVHVNLNQLMNKKLTIIGFGLILGLIVGIGGIIGVMYLNNTYKNQKSLEEEIGLTVIGVIPKID